MTDFNQAIKWLREGKKVRRPSWEKESYWMLGIDESIQWMNRSVAHVHLNQIKANDWEIFKEEKRCPDVFIERAALCTIDGIRALCGTDKEYSEYVKKVCKDKKGEMKPEVIRYQHIRNILEGNYLEAMGKKLFGKKFKGFVKEITFMHSEGFMTRKIIPIEGTPTEEWRGAIKRAGLIGTKF